MLSPRWRETMLATLLVWVTAPLAADEFLLKTGGQIHGIWLNWQAPSSCAYEIRTEQGVLLTLTRDRVSIALRHSPVERAYEERRSSYADTVADQWRFAEWCGEQGLDRQRDRHLRRVVELDPAHVPARRALGYVQISGKWTTRRQLLREKGYVLHDGRWRLPQEAQLLDDRQQVRAGEGDWHAKLKQWRARLSSDDARDAWNRIGAIRDPSAIRALASFLLREQQRSVKLLYIDVLGAIDDHRALAVLIATALHDPDPEVFHASVDKIVARKTPDLVKLFSRMLRDPNNMCVNRAAGVLARLGDSVALPPLVEALVTTHVRYFQGSETLTVGMERQLSPPGDSPFAAEGTALDDSRIVAQGPREARTLSYRLANTCVLDALVKLSGGVSFGYDQAAWRRWLMVQRERAPGTSTLQARSN